MVILRGFELTERGKITLAVLIVIPILILSIILAVITLSRGTAEPPPETSHESQIPELIVTQPEPPGNGGFPPPETEEEPVEEPDEPTEEEPDDNDGESVIIEVIGNPTVNLTAGRFSFFFSLNNQTSLDRQTSMLLDTFLTSPRNVPDSKIAIETPKLSADDTKSFMSIMTGALGERNIESQRIVHIIDPEIPLSEHIEVILYYIENSNK